MSSNECQCMSCYLKCVTGVSLVQITARRVLTRGLQGCRARAANLTWQVCCSLWRLATAFPPTWYALAFCDTYAHCDKEDSYCKTACPPQLDPMTLFPAFSAELHAPVDCAGWCVSQVLSALRPKYHNASGYLPLVFPVDDHEDCRVCAILGRLTIGM